MRLLDRKRISSRFLRGLLLPCSAKDGAFVGPRLVVSLLRFGLIPPVVLLALSGCADEKEISQSGWERLISIRAEARAYYSELREAEYGAHAYGTPSRFEEITGRYQSLFDEENLSLLQRVEDSFPPGTEERRARLLRHYLIDGLLLSAASQSRDYLSTLRLKEKVFDGRDSLSYLDLPSTLSDEPNRERRRVIFDAQLPALQKENAIWQKTRAIEDSVLLGVGYGDMVSYLQERQDCDLYELSRLATEFITATDSLAESLFSELAPKLAGVHLNAFRGYDLAYFQRAGFYDERFPAGTMVAVLKQTLTRMGFEIDTIKGLTLDLENRSGKASLPATYAVEIPSDVRLVVKPTGGQGDYAAFYHEMGHALHALHIGERDFEFLYLGDKSVTETFAFLLEHLLDDPHYLQSTIGLTGNELRDFLRFRALTRLMYIRSYCGDLLYEQILYSGSDDARAAYEQIKQPLLGYPWNEVEREGYLRRADYFYSADYLRAWLLEAQIKEKLRSQFGDDYFNKQSTGDYLTKLMSAGSRYSLQDFATLAGVDTLSTPPLIRAIMSMLEPD